MPRITVRSTPSIRTVGSSNVKSPKMRFVVPASARLISSGTMNTVFGCGGLGHVDRHDVAAEEEELGDRALHLGVVAGRRLDPEDEPGSRTATPSPGAMLPNTSSTSARATSSTS